MSDADRLKPLRRLEIPGHVTLHEGAGGLLKAAIRTEHSAADVYLHGAHVTDFRATGQPPMLFMSSCSRFEAGQPIRGGVPVIFPWFGAREGEPSHGFARTTEWGLHGIEALPAGGVTLRFSLPETAEAGAWPSFTAHYVVTVTGTLALDLIVTNTAERQDFTFESCLHTYLAVGDIHQVSIRGLQGVDYLDKVDGFARKTELAEAMRIRSEVDRVYLDTAGPVDVHDPAMRRTLRVEKSGSASTVVWNPWIAKSQQMPDFGNDEYARMVCVESGNVDRNRMTLAPGRSTVLSVRLSSRPLS